MAGIYLMLRYDMGVELKMQILFPAQDGGQKGEPDRSDQNPFGDWRIVKSWVYGINT